MSNSTKQIHISLICVNKMLTRCNRFFIADLIACSTCFGHHCAHHQELKSIIQWLLRVVFCAVVFSSSILQTGHITLSSTPDQLLEKTTARNTTGSNHCIILLSSWWWAHWCPKHVEHAIRSAIKTSVASSWHFISTQFIGISTIIDTWATYFESYRVICRPSKNTDPISKVVKCTVVSQMLT